MSKQFTLGKKERLKSRKQIDKLFAEGKSVAVNPFRVYFRFGQLPDTGALLPGVQFGVGVSSRNFKKATDRNRLKRLTREAWRLQNTGLKEKMKSLDKQLNVFFVYTGKELSDFKTLKDKVAVALKKLGDKIDENASADT